MRTGIRGGWVVGYDPATGGHELIQDGTVVVENDRVVFVGRDWAEPLDREIEARHALVSPGFVNTHVHAGIEAMAGLFDLPAGTGGRWLGASTEYLSGLPESCLTEEQIQTHMTFGLV